MKGFLGFLGFLVFLIKIIFPSIFKGEHLKHDECCINLTGKTIHVSFDRACALQIDGETVPEVYEYTVEA